MIEYYGRDIGVKIMPTGVNPDRFLSGFEWEDTIWRRGELLTQVLLETSSPHIKAEAGWLSCQSCYQQHWSAAH